MDPVQFPHRFSKREDIEIAAFLASAIAWGRRDLIIKSAERMFSLLGLSPHAFIMDGDYKKLKENCVHRTFFEKDLKYFCKGFKACYKKYGNLENLFASALNAPGGSGDIWEGIVLFREEMAKGNGGVYTKHIANSEANSACKRINLSLRWLVRREGPIDLGIWKGISPSLLIIPLDVHVGRVSRSLGLLASGRQANDKKTAIALTEKLRGFCLEDPIKYDLALFGMGAAL
ncbi:TIGR02757 family protein [Leadbettera azotonutricia]|uniref:TIGR02757 family protein n=1 Tax=Leadbettera azotonutricia (strain ATCC BAA-888 / DSM 13862 / ZAS-9) TaxID=545695 RepID=F5YDY9_LEAAZ|nr:TIGR02757 family protein [Leadbettera azotonutricia]AEF81531.1 conserved hypothetical protein [Leadbettera azotonutricia ZAS-9]